MGGGTGGKLKGEDSAAPSPEAKYQPEWVTASRALKKEGPWLRGQPGTPAGGSPSRQSPSSSSTNQGSFQYFTLEELEADIRTAVCPECPLWTGLCHTRA